MNNVLDFARFKAEGKKISIVTAYDAWSARLVARSRVDAVLVGDSAAMVMHGHETTLAATVALMALHTRAVARSVAGKFLIADLPFLSFRKGIPAAMTRRRRARGERRASGEARRRGRPRGRHPAHRRVRRAGDGTRRVDAPVGQPVRRLPRPGKERCGGGAAHPPGARPRGPRLLLDRASSAFPRNSPRRITSRGARSHHRHRRGPAHRRAGARPAGPLGRGYEPDAAVRAPLRRWRSAS